MQIKWTDLLTPCWPKDRTTLLTSWLHCDRITACGFFCPWWLAGETHELIRKAYKKDTKAATFWPACIMYGECAPCLTYDHRRQILELEQMAGSQPVNNETELKEKTWKSCCAATFCSLCAQCEHARQIQKISKKFEVTASANANNQKTVLLAPPVVSQPLLMF